MTSKKIFYNRAVRTTSLGHICSHCSVVHLDIFKNHKFYKLKKLHTTKGVQIYNLT